MGLPYTQKKFWLIFIKFVKADYLSSTANLSLIIANEQKTKDLAFPL